jgi:hypothetical protein
MKFIHHNMKTSFFLKTLLFCLVFCALQSCMTTKTPVGNYLSTQGKEQTYDKGKQFWVFWGLVPLGRKHVSTPADGNCQVTTKFKFTDLLINGLTGGIISSYSIKVETKVDTKNE